jgi:amino acid adenylation domain-containing protein
MSDAPETAAKLSAEDKRALLARLLQQKAAARRTFPLSSAQLRLWILDRLQPGSAAYNLPLVLRLPGRIDIGMLERSLNEIVRRHETLRTTFDIVDGSPAQIVAPSLELELAVSDVSHVPPEGREAEAGRIIFEECSRPFDLTKGPLLHARLIELDPNDRALVVVMHHIISDGWSLNVFYNELSTLYIAYSAGRPAPLQELTIQYSDFAKWQSEWLSGETVERQLTYWQTQLNGVEAAPDLPTDRPRPPIQSNRGALYNFALERRLCDKMAALSRSEGVTPFITYLAAFKALLSRYTGEPDVVVGTPVAGRTRVELEPLIGFFVNTLVLRTDLSGDPSFRELVGRVREATLGAYAHQDMPFERLVEELRPERDLSRNPLFQIMFSLQSADPSRRSAGGNGPGTDAPTYANGTAKFDLTLFITLDGDGPRGLFEYSTDLFDEATIARMAEVFRFLLQDITDDPDRRVSTLPLIGAMERRELGAGWSGPEVELRAAQNICRAVAEHARRTPDSAALTCDGATMTYGELDGRANRFARHLRGLGIGDGSAVAVLAERSIEAVAAVLGILKAGGTFVPLDPEWPAARTALVLEDARASLVVAEKRFGTSLPSDGPAVFYLDNVGEELARESSAALELNGIDDGLACLLYQSGTSGRPEGIMLTHRALCRTSCGADVSLTAADRVAQTGAFTSSAVCFDLFGALAAGASVTLVGSRQPAPPRRLAALLRDSAITAMIAAPAMFERLAREFPWALRTLRLILCPESPSAFVQPHLVSDPELLERVHAFYGIDEAGGFCASRPIASPPPDGVLPVGRPAAGTTLRLLDSASGPVPDNVVGEICVASDVLACGYYRQPARTASVFVPDPFSTTPGARLCRTGDWGRRRGGELEHKGRSDGRIVARGVRVEPAEVETALLAHPGIIAAAFVPSARPGPREPESAAFVVAASDQPVTPEDLRDFLRQLLPEAMIPTRFILLDEMPKNGQDRTDRRALAALAAVGDGEGSPAPPHVAPRDAVEERLARIWAQTFNLPEVGVHDNFFRLGGHSLLATQVVARVSDAFEIDLPLSRLFSAPTVAELAKVVEQSIQAGSRMKAPPIMRVARQAVTLPSDVREAK